MSVFNGVAGDRNVEKFERERDFGVIAAAPDRREVRRIVKRKLRRVFDGWRPGPGARWSYDPYPVSCPHCAGPQVFVQPPGVSGVIAVWCGGCGVLVLNWVFA